MNLLRAITATEVVLDLMSAPGAGDVSDTASDAERAVGAGIGVCPATQWKSPM